VPAVLCKLHTTFHATRGRFVSMATIAPGTWVELIEGESQRLSFPPPRTALVVAVHRAAVKARGNPLTFVASIDDGQRVDWVGAIDETMLKVTGGPVASPRAAVGRRLLAGASCWKVVRPGLLTSPGVANPYLTLYGGNRPWVVLGELLNGSLVAAPLNDARGNPKWYAPEIAAAHLLFPNAKHSQLELAHLWSLPPGLPSSGEVDAAARQALGRDVVGYYV